MEAVADRRRRARILRKKREEDKFLEEFSIKIENDVNVNYCSSSKHEPRENVKNLSGKIPDFRMQNSKGAKTMFIKP